MRSKPTGVMDEAGRDAEVLALFERHGPMSALALGRLAEPRARSSGQSGRVGDSPVRTYSCGWGRGCSACRISARRWAKAVSCRKVFLEPEVLQAAAFGVRTGEQRFLFPCWSETLEKALREAAEQQSHELSLRWGRVIDSGATTAPRSLATSRPHRSCRRARPARMPCWRAALSPGRIRTGFGGLAQPARAQPGDGAERRRGQPADSTGRAGRDCRRRALVQCPFARAAACRRRFAALTTARFRAGELNLEPARGAGVSGAGGRSSQLMPTG